MVTRIKTTGITDDAITAAKIAAGAVGTSEVADGSIALGDLSADATPAFTKSYTSADQTITAAGTLTLTHGLGAAPKLIRVTLKCATAENGYSVGDEVEFFGLNPATADRGVALIPGTSSIVVRYGSAAATFTVLNKTTGVAAAITNANWRMVVRAWA